MAGMIDPRMFDPATFASDPLAQIRAAAQAPLGLLNQPGAFPQDDAALPQNATSTVGPPTNVVPQAPSPGFFGSLGRGIGDNSNLLMALGAGIAGGKDWGDAISKGLMGGMQGAQLDRARGAENLTYQALIKRGLDPETALAAVRDKTLLAAVLPALYKPQMKPMTPEQKTALGLPTNLPWFLGADGKPTLPEGFAQAKPEVTKDNAGNPITVNPWTNTAQPVSGITPQPKLDDVSGIRKEVTALPSIKKVQEAVPIFNSMIKSFNNNSRAADLDFVYGMAKIFDPDSVVREGEMVIVKQAQNLPDAVLGAINKINGGQGLGQQTRFDLLNVSKTRVDEYKRTADADVERYRGIATRGNIRPDDVLPSLATPEAVPNWKPADLPRPRTFEEALKLKKGTRFIDPNGVERTR